MNDEEDLKTQIGWLFAMPFGETLEIRSSKPIDDSNVECDEELEDVVYSIYWNNIELPWCTKTKFQAMAIACGCQWGAMEMQKKMLR